LNNSGKGAFADLVREKWSPEKKKKKSFSSHDSRLSKKEKYPPPISGPGTHHLVKIERPPGDIKRRRKKRGNQTMNRNPGEEKEKIVKTQGKLSSCGEARKRPRAKLSKQIRPGGWLNNQKSGTRKKKRRWLAAPVRNVKKKYQGMRSKGTPPVSR